MMKEVKQQAEKIDWGEGRNFQPINREMAKQMEELVKGMFPEKTYGRILSKLYHKAFREAVYVIEDDRPLPVIKDKVTSQPQKSAEVIELEEFEQQQQNELMKQLIVLDDEDAQEREERFAIEESRDDEGLLLLLGEQEKKDMDEQVDKEISWLKGREERECLVIEIKDDEDLLEPGEMRAPVRKTDHSENFSLQQGKGQVPNLIQTQKPSLIQIQVSESQQQQVSSHENQDPQEQYQQQYDNEEDPQLQEQYEPQESDPSPQKKTKPNQINQPLQAILVNAPIQLQRDQKTLQSQQEEKANHLLNQATKTSQKPKKEKPKENKEKQTMVKVQDIGQISEGNQGQNVTEKKKRKYEKKSKKVNSTVKQEDIGNNTNNRNSNDPEQPFSTSQLPPIPVPFMSTPSVPEYIPKSYLSIYPDQQTRPQRYDEFFHEEFNALNLDTDKRMKLGHYVKAFIEEGYGKKKYKKVYPYEEEPQEQEYKLAMMAIIKTTFRMLQKFIRLFCNTQLIELSANLQLKYLFEPMLNYDLNFKMKKNILLYHKLLKIIYKLPDNLQTMTISKQEAIQLYNCIVERMISKMLEEYAKIGDKEQKLLYERKNGVKKEYEANSQVNFLDDDDMKSLQGARQDDNSQFGNSLYQQDKSKKFQELDLLSIDSDSLDNAPYSKLPGNPKPLLQSRQPIELGPKPTVPQTPGTDKTNTPSQPQQKSKTAQSTPKLAKKEQQQLDRHIALPSEHSTLLILLSKEPQIVGTPSSKSWNAEVLFTFISHYIRHAKLGPIKLIIDQEYPQVERLSLPVLKIRFEKIFKESYRLIKLQVESIIAKQEVKKTFNFTHEQDLCLKQLLTCPPPLAKFIIRFKKCQPTRKRLLNFIVRDNATNPSEQRQRALQLAQIGKGFMLAKQLEKNHLVKRRERKEGDKQVKQMHKVKTQGQDFSDLQDDDQSDN